GLGGAARVPKSFLRGGRGRVPRRARRFAPAEAGHGRHLRPVLADRRDAAGGREEDEAREAHEPRFFWLGEPIHFVGFCLQGAGSAAGNRMAKFSFLSALTTAAVTAR